MMMNRMLLPMASAIRAIESATTWRLPPMEEKKRVFIL